MLERELWLFWTDADELVETRNSNSGLGTRTRDSRLELVETRVDFGPDSHSVEG